MRNALIIFCVLLVACSPYQNSRVVVYPAPDQEEKSSDFEVEVNGQPSFVYQARVSKFPINQIWPGYQRPVSQTEMASFTYFDFKGKVQIRIKSNKEIETVKIRPTKYGITPVIKDNIIEFELSEPLQFSVEINGYHNALHIFANDIDDFSINKKDPAVHYFGPGIHDAGAIEVKSGETVFIDGGAIVYGFIKSENARDIKIAGKGILDAGKLERGGAPAMIYLKNVTNADVSGIILRDSPFWAIIPTNCDSVNFDNLKLIGHWRYNSDGLDVVNCKNIRFENSFIRTFDDNIVVRGTRRAYNDPFKIIENVTVDNCVLWNDWGRAIEIGASIVADTIRNITFSNCMITHFTAVALDIQNCDRGVITDILYKNIDIEGLISDSLTIGTTPIVPCAWGKIAVLGIYSTFYSEDTTRGNINHITFENIRYKREFPLPEVLSPDDKVPIDENSSLKEYDKFIRDNMYFGDIQYNAYNAATFYFSGFDSLHQVENILVKDYYIEEVKVTDLATIGKNEFVRGISIR